MMTRTFFVTWTYCTIGDALQLPFFGTNWKKYSSFREFRRFEGDELEKLQLFCCDSAQIRDFGRNEMEFFQLARRKTPFGGK